VSALSDIEFRSILNFVRARALRQPRPRLADVTCFCATSVRIPRAIETLRLCAEFCEFDEVVLATHKRIHPERIPFARVASVRQIENINQYSRLILDELKRLVHTKYVLVVQDDGFILNPGVWTDRFLEYDYIGAPWPPTLTIKPQGTILRLENRVGNGGFSLRSRRLLETVSFDALIRPHDVPVIEDILIGHFNYRQLVGKGIRFADVTLAGRFAAEAPVDDGTSDLNEVFGFHGGIVFDVLASETRRLYGRQA
jgi:hypothetical protein